MTVRELIEGLSKQSPDAEVMLVNIWRETMDYMKVTRISEVNPENFPNTVWLDHEPA